MTTLDELATPEVTPSEDMRAAFALAAQSIRAAAYTDHPDYRPEWRP